MRLHRFYIDKEIHGHEGDFFYKDPTSQLRKVFRLAPKDQVIVFDGSGYEYVSEIKSWGEEKGESGAYLTIISSKKSDFNPKRNVALASSLIKKDNFEWICQKATELGVSEILPIISERTEKKSINMDRVAVIVKEASEQSGRFDLPKVYEPKNVDDLFEKKEKDTIFLVCDQSGDVTLSEFLEKIDQEQKQRQDNQRKIVLFIGPEGGWSQKEIEYFRAKDCNICSLGKLVLRAETAVVSALSILLL